MNRKVKTDEEVDFFMSKAKDMKLNPTRPIKKKPVKKSNHHRKVFAEHFELALIGALVVVGVDILWVVRDILANGLSGLYAVIVGGLIYGALVMVRVLVLHHRTSVKKYRRFILSEKLKLAHRLTRHKEKHHE